MTSRRQFLCATGAGLATGRLPAADPADSLPPHITRLTWFGERADWRHDGRRFVFLNRAYGLRPDKAGALAAVFILLIPAGAVYAIARSGARLTRRNTAR